MEKWFSSKGGSLQNYMKLNYPDNHKTKHERLMAVSMLLVQIEQQKHYKKDVIMFEVNNKNTRTMSMTSFWR